MEAEGADEGKDVEGKRVGGMGMGRGVGGGEEREVGEVGGWEGEDEGEGGREGVGLE